MRPILLRTCALDRAGIPDISDLQWIRLDATSIIAISIHVSYDCWQDPALAYPFAAIEMREGFVFCALEPETDHARLEVSVNLLQAALGNLGAPLHTAYVGGAF